MSVFPFMVFLFFPCKLVLVSSEKATLPSKIRALIGSCVQIPCTFEAPNDKLNSAASIFGIWIKTDHSFLNPARLVVFDGKTNITKGFSHIEILGNLRMHDCTTVFYDVMKNHSDKYYFRVEVKPQNWLYTYSDNYVYISVSDEPKPPVLNPTDLKEVMEGSPVTLNCSAEAPCPEQPPTISWSDIPESANITTQIKNETDKTQSVFSLMSFKASYRDHRKNISCTAKYPRNTSNVSTVETSVTLQILFAPKETHININASASVSVGTNVTLTCECKANPSKNMNYTWYKRGQEQDLGFGELLTFSVDSGSGGLYFCTARNELGNQTSDEIQLTVIDSKRSVSLDIIVAIVAGVAVFLFLFLIVTLFLRVQRVKASIIKETDVSDQFEVKPVQISPVYTNGAFALSEESRVQKDDNDTIQYGEINFSTPQNQITPANRSGVETVYAEVSREQ